MASASLKITTRDGATECFSEPVGDYETMDKALHRLQEQSNTLLTVHVEKEKEMNLTKNSGDIDEDNDDEEDSSEEDGEGDKNNDKDQDKPPEKKIKL